MGGRQGLVVSSVQLIAPSLVIVVLASPGTIFTTLHFLCNLQMGPISRVLITINWKCLPGTNPKVNWANL
jgi:hypothetical protein